MYIHAYIHICICVCICMYIHAYMYVYICMYVYGDWMNGMILDLTLPFRVHDLWPNQPKITICLTGGENLL